MRKIVKENPLYKETDSAITRIYKFIHEEIKLNQGMPTSISRFRVLVETASNPKSFKGNLKTLSDRKLIRFKEFQTGVFVFELREKELTRS